MVVVIPFIGDLSSYFFLFEMQSRNVLSLATS